MRKCQNNIRYALQKEKNSGLIRQFKQNLKKQLNRGPKMFEDHREIRSGGSEKLWKGKKRPAMIKLSVLGGPQFGQNCDKQEESKFARKGNCAKNKVNGRIRYFGTCL